MRETENIQETLQNEISTINWKLKLIDNLDVVIDFFNRKESLFFEAFGRKTELFRSIHSTLFSCGDLTISSRDVEHYQEMYKISFNQTITEVKPLKKALKFIEANIDEDDAFNTIVGHANFRLS